MKKIFLNIIVLLIWGIVFNIFNIFVVLAEEDIVYADVKTYYYLEGTTTRVSSTSIQSMEVGSTYETVAKDVEGYTVVYSSNNTKGTVSSSGEKIIYYYNRNDFNIEDYFKYTGLSDEVKANIQSNIDAIESGEVKITYELFGAKGDGVTDDTVAIKAAHDFANAENMYNNLNLVVYGTNGSTYYMGKEVDSITIATDVDWDNANFIIDDGIIDPTNEEEASKLENHIFRVFSKMRYKVTSHSLGLTKDTVIENNISISKGMKKSLELSNFIKNFDTSDTSKYISGTLIQLAGIKREFENVSQYMIMVFDTETRHHIRGGTTTYPPSSSAGNSKQEIFIMDKEGNILSDVFLDFDNITQLYIYPIYDDELIIKNGNFVTKTNNQVYNEDGSKNSYISRDIYVMTSNVTFENINHDLDEDSYSYIADGYQKEQNGNLYSGFINTYKCANVSIKNSNFRAHSYTIGITSSGGNVYNGTYDFAFYSTVGINLDNVGYIKREGETEKEAYYENMNNTSTKWSIMGVTFCKDLKIINSKINVVSSHQSTYNISVSNSTIGSRGFVLMGGGYFNVNNVTLDGADNIIRFHEDYGTTWNGSVTLNDIKFIASETKYSLVLIKANLKEDRYYGYQSYFPNIYINNLEVDDSLLTNDSSKVFLITYNEGSSYDEEEALYKYYFSKDIIVKNLTIKNRKLSLFTSTFVNNGYLYQSKYTNEGDDEKTIIALYNVSLNDDVNIADYNVDGSQFKVVDLSKELPNTGSSGIIYYVIGGFILLVGGLVSKLIIKSKKQML